LNDAGTLRGVCNLLGTAIRRIIWPDILRWFLQISIQRLLRFLSSSCKSKRGFGQQCDGDYSGRHGGFTTHDHQRFNAIASWAGSLLLVPKLG